MDANALYFFEFFFVKTSIKEKKSKNYKMGVHSQNALKTHLAFIFLLLWIFGKYFVKDWGYDSKKDRE